MTRLTAPILLLMATAAGAQPAASLPETPPGKLMHEWVQAFNATDRAKLATFIREHYSDGVLRGRPPEEIASNQLRLRERLGPLEVSSIEKSTDIELIAVFKTPGVLPQFVRAAWQTDGAKPNRIQSSAITPVAAPASAGFGKLTLPELGKDLDAKLDELTSRDLFSGVALIAKDGKPVWQKITGLADREQKRPATAETRFRLGSMNKMFTSVAIAQLVEAGKLKFTDTVDKILPDYPNQDVAKKITVHHLLTHTAGMGNIFGAKFDQLKDKLHDLKDYLPLFSSEPLQFEPGKAWSYSNAGFIVLGLIVEKVSGENYYDYVQHHIYDKAGMKSSGDIPKTERGPEIAVGYMKMDDRLLPNWDTLPYRGMSAGGGDSTAADLLKFAIALRSYALLSRELTEKITSAQAEPAPGSPEKYGYGFGVREINGQRVVGHGGGAPGMNADLSIFWDSGYTVIVLANLDPPAAENVSRYIQQRLPD